MDRANNESRVKQQQLQQRENRMRDLKDEATALRFKIQERQKMETQLAELQADLQRAQKNQSVRLCI